MDNCARVSTDRHVVGTCMHERIEDTLGDIAGLASPVARSCHVGNNTSNVWGWLALSRNAKIVQFDHTRYGLDENCLPWTVLGDRGRLIACYDHKGVERSEWIGRHVSEHLSCIEPRHFGLLNYQIRAAYNDRDLLQFHFATASLLAAQINGTSASCDSAELLSIAPLVRSVIDHFVQCRCLHLAFDRWVKSDGGRNRKVISHPIRLIEYPRVGEVAITDSNGRRVFHGRADELWLRLMDGARTVFERLVGGEPIGAADYPWFTLELSYLMQSVKEFSIDRTQDRFWHAGGSASQYYINSPDLRRRASAVRDALVGADLLPPEAYLTIIPTFCCQLFATSAEGLAILEDILHEWRTYLKEHRKELSRALLDLRCTVDPFEVARQAYATIDSDFLQSLDRAVSAFNAVDANRLPVAHVAYRRHSHYNKFGAAQSAFLNAIPRFPSGFHDLRWEEAELLIKVMAQMYVDRPE